MEEKEHNLLYQAASLWKELAEYRYIFTYGYKNKLYEVTLTFSMEDFPHLAGFQYLKDIKLPRHSRSHTVQRILDAIHFVFIIKSDPHGTVKCDYLCCSAFVKGERDYEENQRPRAILKKERIHIPTNTTTVLYDRLSD